jgi:cytochrome c oxidase assembly factor CtaG
MSGWDVAATAALAAVGVLYLRGTRRLLVRGATVRRSESMAFCAGWVAAVAVLVPPVDTWTATLFSAHMFQHEILMLVAAPLMVAGRPVLPLLWACPDRWRARATHAPPTRSLTRFWSMATLPAGAWLLHGVIVWGWHLPVLYEAAVRSEAIHALQHAMFAGTAVLFWWGLIYGRYGRMGYGVSVLYVFSTLVHTGVLGALFALSRTPYYRLYVERGAAAGVNPLVDQQLAGLYMWIPAGVVLTCFGLGLFAAWLAASGQRGVRLQPRPR